MQNRAGNWKKNLTGELSFLSFVPAPLPPDPPIALSDELSGLLSDANRQIAKLDAMAAFIPDVNLFVSMYVRKEALMSSQIEGTQATLEDILDPAVEQNTNRNVADVINYVKAIEFSTQRLRELPLCNRLLKETHAILMEGVRGQEKNPGEFRRSQNWIGGQGSTLKNARYIPPAPTDMETAMSDLEKYMNEDNQQDLLIQAALIHYQFETIHPFLDGNGRIGRLLILLFLMEKKLLVKPALYISYFLKKNRVEYYDRMTEVRIKGNYEQWIRFFLDALVQSASDASETIMKLLSLHEKNSGMLNARARNSKHLLTLFSYVESNPIINIQKTAKALGLSYGGASGAVKRLTEAGILVRMNGNRRNRIFAYQAYLDILREGTEM